MDYTKGKGEDCWSHFQEREKRSGVYDSVMQDGGVALAETWLTRLFTVTKGKAASPGTDARTRINMVVGDE